MANHQQSNRRTPLPLSIIVPTYERPQNITTLLQSICSQLKSDDEVIIVDDGSSPQARDSLLQRVGEIDKSNIKIIFEEHIGRRSARNKGIHKAQHETLLFVDDDCVAAPNWLEEMRKSLTTSDVVQGNFWAQQCRKELDRQHELWRMVASTAKTRDTKNRIGTINARNFGINKKRLIEVCGAEPFNPDRDASGGGDVLIGIRLFEIGIDVVLNQNAIVYHGGDASSVVGLMRQKYGHGRGDGLMGAYPPDILSYKNFRRAAWLPVLNGVSPRLAIPLWLAYTFGTVSGILARRMR